VEPLLPIQAEFADAPWELDYSIYAFLPDGRIACRYRQQGLDHLGILDPAMGYLEPVAVPFTSIKPYLRATRDRLAFIAASPTTTPAVITLACPTAVLRSSPATTRACLPTIFPFPSSSGFRPMTAVPCTLPTIRPPITPSPRPRGSVPR
jgi:hypothetical protein